MPGSWHWLTQWRRRRRERAKWVASLEQLRPLTYWGRLARIGITCAAVVAACQLLDQGGVFHHLEQYTYNVRQSVFAARHVDLADEARKKIVLVPISDTTLTSFGLAAPPVPRQYHAKLIAELTRAGAKVIVLDLSLFDSSPQDAALAAAARASGRVLWSCCFEDENTPQQRLMLPTERLRQTKLPWGHIHVASDSESGEIDLIEAVKHCGGRSVRSNSTWVPALSLMTVMMARGLDTRPLYHTAGTWHVGDLDVPVNADGRLHISYFRRPGEEIFLPIPYEDIYGGVATRGESAEVYRQVLNGKIVIVGDATTPSDDYYFTPVGTMLGMEIQAHAVATLLLNAYVREAPWWLNLAALCALAAVACPLAAAWRLLWAVLATLGLLIGYLLLNVWLFVDRGVWLHLFAPSAAMFLTTVGLLIERDLAEEREKNRFRALLRRYLSPQTAEYVISHPEKCLLGGERVTATVLFVDLRGFTTVSSKLPPEQVVVRLNEFFQVMTDIVFRHQGAVDKYLGDNVMALFGIPVPIPDHPHRAVAAAIDMHRAMGKLQSQWQMQGLPPLDLGIGINTGDMVVGNMGANERWDFTVVGDVVNLASRVEGLNRDLGTHVLITTATYECVKDEVQTRGPLTARVRGKEEDIVLYEVLDWRVAPSSSAIDSQEAAPPDATSSRPRWRLRPRSTAKA